MKFFSILSLFLISVIAASAQGKYQIQGHVKGLPDSTVIFLMEDDGSALIPIARDTCFNGAFSFQGKTNGKEAQGLELYIPGDAFPMRLNVWVASNSIVKIFGNNNFLKTWRVESNIKEQKETNRFIQASFVNLEKLQEVLVAQRQLSAKRRKASDVEKIKLKNEMAVLSTTRDSLQMLIIKKDLEVLQQSPVSNIWLSRLKSIAIDVRQNKTGLREPAVQLLSRLSPEQKESQIGREIIHFLFPATAVKTGEPMADADLYDLGGTLRKLEDYKGKYLLLDFWSRGCGPCMMAMPELGEFSETNKDKLTVISLSLDTKKEIWKKISEQQKISWVNLSDGKGMAGIAAKYGVEAIPHYVMISPEGKVLGSWVGYEKGLLARKFAEYAKGN